MGNDIVIRINKKNSVNNSSVNPSCALLSNFEVMEALRTIGDTKKKLGLRNLATISYEVSRRVHQTGKLCGVLDFGNNQRLHNWKGDK